MTQPKLATRLRDLKTSARDQLMLDPRIIVIEEGHNPRDYTLKENRDHLDELKASIRENGTLMPLWVRFEPATGSAVLVDGECRLRANMELIDEGLEIEAVPTIQVAGKNEVDRLMTAITANTGKPLSQWEIGNAFKRLVGFGWEVVKIATKLGFKERFVTEAIELADAPMDVKRMLSEEAVTPSLALRHLRKDGSGATVALKEAVREAHANAKPSKSGKTKKVTAKRTKSKSKFEEMVRISKKSMAVIIDALEDASTSPDKKIGPKAEKALVLAKTAK